MTRIDNVTATSGRRSWVGFCVVAGLLPCLMGDAADTNAPTAPITPPAPVPVTVAATPVAKPSPVVSKAATATPAASTKKKVGFGDFKSISQLNIFNPNRAPKVIREVSRAPRKPKVEAFGLVGTMSSDKGQVAFFDGTKSSFKKVVHVGEAIAGYTVADIGASRVKLKSEAQEIDLPLRFQLRREDEGEWKRMELTQNFTPAYHAPEHSTMATAATDGRSQDKTSSKLALLDALAAGEPVDISEKQMKKLDRYLGGDEVKGDKGVKEFKEKEFKDAWMPKDMRDFRKSDRRGMRSP